MSFTAQDVKSLRESTGAGMMDCKKALEETGGDLEAAKQFLREKGLAASAKRDDRENNQGVVAISVSGGTGAIVQLKSETDFVAGNDDFKAFCKDVAMQIAAMNPEAVRREEIDAERVEAEKAVFRVEANMKTCKACGAINKLEAEGLMMFGQPWILPELRA